MTDQIACVALIFGMAALCNMASIAVVQLIQATGVIA
jgi:N-acetylglutamate synthase-like GNAT family acetyltransferase